jgi:hypothetical protein
MLPRIKSNQLVHVEPITGDLKVDDIVFCKVKGKLYVHLITAKDSKGRFQISNNKGRVNGWASAIYGKVTSVTD